MQLKRLLPLSFVLALAWTARADDLPGPISDTCTVNRSCSATGVACAPTDSKCMSDATAKHLEVFCEDRRTRPPTLVYCPASTGRADSKFIWVLLAAAVALAVGGTVFAFHVLRKKDA